jgi:hypothetical protein
MIHRALSTVCWSEGSSRAAQLLALQPVEASSSCTSNSTFNLPLPSIPPYPNMKLAFVFAVLASMAVLSLAAPPLDGDEAMLQALEATLGAETHGSASADATEGPVSDEGPAPVTDLETGMTSVRLVRYILITSPRDTWMSISWVACYDGAGMCCFTSCFAAL